MQQLEIINEIEYKVGEVNFNKEKVKNEVEEYIKKFDNLIITDYEEIKDFKEIRANLNKVIKTIEDKRKLIKAEYSTPLTQFEKDVKEIVSIIDNVNSKIDIQIKDFEQKQKDAKKELIIKYLEKYNLAEYLDLIFKEEWLNKTCSITTIEDELIAIEEKIKGELLAIENFSTSNIEKAELLNDYKKSLDLAGTMQKYNERKNVIKSVVNNDDNTKHNITLEICATKGEMEMIKDLLEKLNVEYKRVK